jgi:1,4-alpha-glucan branching enzyme
VAELAFAARAAELRVLGAGDPPALAVRELLALQASDWAFLQTRGTAGDYPRRRADEHGRALDAALAGIASNGIRNLAVHATPAPLLEP